MGIQQIAGGKEKRYKDLQQREEPRKEGRELGKVSLSRLLRRITEIKVLLGSTHYYLGKKKK